MTINVKDATGATREISTIDDLLELFPAALTGSGNLKVALVESTAPQKVIGQATWTKTTITLTGNSDQLLAANAARVGFIVVNRVGNAQIDVDIAGGTVAANTGRPIFAGNDYFFTGVYCPTGIVTVKGTNGQIVNVWEAV
ncbi:hypothetical protein [Reyranella sp.]|jgi:hypothetical protein|uniref:hypothetical protein n=1 Tax=Reyranella sp. TaxID=1929291 RepID=UPI000BD7902C|nr:hypothetical protein [Reyranella sp.]OYY35547.1 MAG: hypothetical protein B7Y57_25540 [Rhodospirillales bacterium 35-66-84]OYZ91417.1 MAG: hypothetical protein B7Y08_25410 [Rhodospirillales bacterium 24-66-33]OZB26247.1 MAG: hypothetical protein B7X63_09920 [Rhodospirillales bacterium 39-66-50]HQS15034.1 hypothetical protein [Reyranella sp.]HQT10843.1 hypothetical protein [Reyranella sp.]